MLADKLGVSGRRRAPWVVCAEFHSLDISAGPITKCRRCLQGSPQIAWVFIMESIHAAPAQHLLNTQVDGPILACCHLMWTGLRIPLGQWEAACGFDLADVIHCSPLLKGCEVAALCRWGGTGGHSTHGCFFAPRGSHHPGAGGPAPSAGWPAREAGEHCSLHSDPAAETSSRHT